MQTHEIVKGPHELSVGANGHKTYGITVRSLGPKSEVEDRGYKREHSLNDYTISRSDLSGFGLTSDEIVALKQKIGKLSLDQK